MWPVESLCMAVGCIEPVPHDLPDDVELWHVDLDQLPVRPRSGDLQCRRTQSRRALPVRRRSPPLPGSTSCPASRAWTCARSTAWCAGIPDGRPWQATSARWTWTGVQSEPQPAAVPDRHQRRSTNRRGRGSRSTRRRYRCPGEASFHAQRDRSSGNRLRGPTAHERSCRAGRGRKRV